MGWGKSLLLVEVLAAEELVLLEETFLVELGAAVDALETVLVVGLVLG